MWLFSVAVNVEEKPKAVLQGLNVPQSQTRCSKVLACSLCMLGGASYSRHVILCQTNFPDSEQFDLFLQR